MAADLKDGVSIEVFNEYLKQTEFYEKKAVLIRPEEEMENSVNRLNQWQTNRIRLNRPT